MKVYFTGSERNFEEDIEYYRGIKEAIFDTGSTLTLDWIEDAYSNMVAKKAGSNDDIRDWGAYS